MEPINIKTEYLKNPLGIDIQNPRFMWNCENGEKQTAYRIIAEENGKVIWDSGKVASNKMEAVYPLPLTSRERISFSIVLYDENGKEGKNSEKNFFEMGLLKKSDFKAKWISGNYKPKKDTRYPADYFKKEFKTAGKIVNARLYITAMGLYEATINGTRVGSFVFAPGFTDYKKRIQYQTYDVTALLGEENTLDIVLGDGWYRGSIGAYGLYNYYGRMTKLFCQLEITYEDGQVKVVNSDSSFRWSNDGPLRFDDMKDGEIFDSNLVPSYNGYAKTCHARIVPTSSDNVPVEEHEVFKPVQIMSESDKLVFDFKQNLAGYLSFDIEGPKGKKVKITCAERVNDKGETDPSSIQCLGSVKEASVIDQFNLLLMRYDKVKGGTTPTPKQEIIFTCSGKKEHYKTKFAIFGFRYAQFEAEEGIKISNICSISVYSSLEETGSFSCSNEKINRLVQNTAWSMKSNYLDIPTDCPTRERMGWTGDAQVFFNTGAYLMNTAPFVRKWLLDIKDDQRSNGAEPAVVPYMGVYFLYITSGSSTGWNDAVILIPSRFKAIFGDERILKDNYPTMKKYAKYLIKHTGFKTLKRRLHYKGLNKYVLEKGFQYGEWLEPVEYNEDPRKTVFVPKTEEATAYLSYVMAAMAKVAEELGYQKDAKLYLRYSQGAKKTYQAIVFANGTPDTDRQAKLVRPLAFNLAEGAQKKALEDRLAASVVNKNYKIQTGFLSTPFILPVLADSGHLDLAYKMLENEEKPSWLYEVDQGATTIWESWEGTASLNHYSPGAVCEWLFKGVAGINVTGVNEFTYKPLPGGDLTHAESHYLSRYGLISTSWKKTEKGISYHLEVPSNTICHVILPLKEQFDVKAGVYDF
jgi:alpha-L-rhamnosidase